MRPGLRGRTMRHDQRMEHVVETIEVGAQHLVPLLAGHAGERGVAGDAGIADHAMVATMRGDIGFERGGGGGAIGHVELQDARHGAARTQLARRPASASSTRERQCSTTS